MRTAFWSRSLASLRASLHTSLRASLPASLPVLVLAALLAPLALPALLMSPAAQAFERSDGSIVSCEVERNGVRRTVQEVWLGKGAVGDRHPELGGAAAVVRTDAEGWPVIYFDNVVFGAMLARDPHMADFVFYHECAHATDPARDEIEANCEAYLQLEQLGLMNAEMQEALARTHRRMLRLPARYGGSGEVFWERTQACVSKRHAEAASRATLADADRNPDPTPR